MHDLFDKPAARDRPAAGTNAEARGVRSVRWRRGTILAALVVGACAGVEPARQKVLDDAFARIQVHEAHIEEGRAALARAGDGASDGPSTCAERTHTAESICAHAGNICDTAREVADADAFARCDDARDACAGARRAARLRCGAARAVIGEAASPTESTATNPATKAGSER